MAQAVVAQHIAEASLPAGTVLASRYRLEELIAESGPTVTWRAFDQVLSRSVLVHLLAPAGSAGIRTGQPGESELLAAARQASVATDSRFVRVLDAVQSTDPELGSYIVCEYTTGQSLEMILSHAPLSGLEAAWVVREVADALAGVHSLGLYHQRINPDTVIITPTGNVKIVGLLIEAALRPADETLVHGADTPELVDVTDLGRLLYACLVSRWPGGPGVQPAGRAGDRPSLGDTAPGPGRSLAVAGQRLRPDPRRPAPAPGQPDHHRARRGQRADQGAGQRRRVGRPGTPAEAADPAGRGDGSERLDAVTGAPPVSSLMDQPTEPAVRRADRRPPAHLPPAPSARTAANIYRSSTDPALGPAATGESGMSTVIRPRSPGSAKTARPRTARTRTSRATPALDRTPDRAGPAAGHRRRRLRAAAGPRLTAGAPPVASTKPSAGSSTSAPPSTAPGR